LTERIRRRPYAVVLLDEIEKAHPDVFNMLLQIMEEGRLTDSFGRHVDFKNVILIMTSNIGADKITTQSTFGFERKDEDLNYEKMRDMLTSEVERYFRPEFLNRLDDMVVFHKLTHEDLVQIVELEMAKVIKRLEDKGLALDVSQEAKDYLIAQGTDEKFGARPLRRAIEQYVEDPLSESILRGDFTDKNLILVHVEGEDDEQRLTFEGTTAESEPEPVAAGNAADAT
jgi:ATP-dependent Clp protease ATP-binding subunit ClpC